MSLHSTVRGNEMAMTRRKRVLGDRVSDKGDSTCSRRLGAALVGQLRKDRGGVMIAN